MEIIGGGGGEPYVFPHYFHLPPPPKDRRLCQTLALFIIIL